MLVSQVGRHLGKLKEKELFRLWGGPPTTKLLRHRHAPNHVRLARLHSDLQQLTGLTFPTSEAEAANPGDADSVYEAAVDYLRNETRDPGRFALVFDELCNYGFRRNLRGCVRGQSQCQS
jgi:hypothetical protein